MCDQTEVIYSPGDVVWVKLGPVWWPGQVFDYDKLPEEITTNLRKKPIAVVKFFQEDSYEYVKNLNAIYHYSCRRKHEFIKKGLDMCRSNNRDVPSNMKMFPNDIVTAEHLTNGDTNILNSREFAPQEKEDYSELFGKKTPKKGKTDSVKKDISSWRSKGVSESSLKGSRHSVPIATIRRPITHPRFITKALEGRSDHEVRIRQQVLPSGSRSSSSPVKQYNCHLCGFSSSRINVIVLHNKSHSAGYADAYLPPAEQSIKGRKIKTERKMVYSSEKRPRISDSFRSEEPPVKKKSVKASVETNLSSVNVSNDKSEKLGDTSGKSKPLKKPVFGRKKSAKDKAEKLAKEKQQNDAFRETLLKDWDEDEDNIEEDKVDSSKEDFNKDKENSVDSSLNLSDKTESNSSKRKEISCFDFDDSEDGLNIGETVMKFGQKIPRVLGDKPKKQTKNLLEESSLDVENSSASKTEDLVHRLISSESDYPLTRNESPEVKESKESSEKETEELQSAFKSLLDETAVPDIPDAPSYLEIKKKNIEFETSYSQHAHNDGGGGDDVNVDTGEDHNSEKGERSEIRKNSLEVDTDVKKVISESGSLESDVSNARIDEHIPCVPNEGASKEISCENSEHFLVKTSEEVATSSSDAQLEECVSPNEGNVAKSENEEKCGNSMNVEDDFSAKIKNNVNEIGVHVKKEIESESELESKPKTEVSVSNDLDKDISVRPEVILSSLALKETEACKTQKNENSLSATNIVVEDIIEDQLQSSDVPKSNVSEGTNFQEMDFDINSMPVIISEDVVQCQDNSVTASSDNSDNFSGSTGTSINSIDNKLITVTNLTKESVVDSGPSYNLPTLLKEEASSGLLPASQGKDKDKTSTRKLIFSPTKTTASARSPQVATIKVQPSVSSATKLTVPGGIISPKNVGGTSQLVIIKSTTPGQPGKSTFQKIGNTSQMIQQGGKVLILTNPQGTAGQSKVLSTLSTQPQILSPGKHTGTRILTTKGTVLTTGSSGTVSRANILSGSSKTVTTKSGQKILINTGGVISQTQKSVIINKSGVLTTVNPTTTTVSNKGSFITQNILTSKAQLTAASQLNSSQMIVSSKGATATILAPPGFTAGKSMILAPVTTNKGTALASNKKLRLITTSKASPVSAASSTGTRLMIQSTPSRMILPSSSVSKNQQLKLVGNLKGQSSTSTILIQTNQGVIAKTPLTSNQVGNKSKVTKPIPTVISSPLGPSSKTTTIQVAQVGPLPQNKLIVPKIKPAGPNILQKTQKKPIQRSNKKIISSQLITTVSGAQSIQTAHTPVTVSSLPSTAQDTLILSPASGLPVIGQSNVVQGTSLDPSNQTALVYLTVDESGNYRPLESTPVVNYEGAAAADPQTLYIDPGTTDLDNIFLAIDDAGNVVNITQPVQNTFTTESSTPPPSQDILAKALANTQVLQQETIATENIPLTSSVESSMLSSCMFVEPQTQYPQPSLSHSVLETSLTLNQPIMTPLEVPSAVSPRSLEQISSLQTGFLSDSSLLTSNTCTGKEKKSIHPSMPLLTEESDCTAASSIENKNDTVFFTQVGVDGSHGVLTPVTSGSQLAFQIALDENNVIVSSTPTVTSLGVMSSANISQNSITYIPHSEIPTVTELEDKKSLLNVNTAVSINTTSPVFTNVSQESSAIKDYQLSVNEQEQVAKSNEDIIVGDVSSESLGLGSQSSIPTSESFETKYEETPEQRNVVSCIIKNDPEEQMKMSIKSNETSIAPVGEGSSSDDLILTHNELTKTETTDNYSEVPVSELMGKDQENPLLNTPTDNEEDNEQDISKTEVVATVRDDTFYGSANNLTVETTFTNSNGDLQSSKRHFEELASLSDNSEADNETKRVKLNER